MILKKVLTSLFLLAFSTIIWSQYTDKSNLADGEIFKLGVTTSGVYKIDYNFLSENGINPDAINPSKLQLLGNGGGLLPEANSDFVADDVIENPIYIKGGTDGSFDQGDYILFYAEGADRWTIKDSSRMEFEKNIYDLKNYYFLKIGSEDGLRISSIAGPSQVDQNFNAVNHYLRHEEDIINLLGNFSGAEGTGQRWYGESFGIASSQDLSSMFDFDNIVTGSDIELEIAMAARSSSSSTADFIIGSESKKLYFSYSIIDKNEAVYADHAVENFVMPSSDFDGKIGVIYNNAAVGDAWLDYIEIKAQEQLIYSNQPRYISNELTMDLDAAGFDITNASTGLFLWDISKPGQTQQYDLTSTPAGAKFHYEVDQQLKQFFLFDPNQNHPSPDFEMQIDQQNLHDIQRADYIIVYPTEFETSAEILAQHRRDEDNLLVETVLIDKIYNEFASGKKDPTALRNFMKMMDFRDDEFNYLLLLGDASYDYRGIVPGLPYQNFVPTYETNESLSPIRGFPSDDYFALLSPNEGGNYLRGALDIAIGRLPARDQENAMDMINKIIHYDTQSSTLGDWRINIGYSADDQDTGTHLNQSDEIARKMDDVNPVFNQQKVYFDAYEQISTPGGERYPEANEALVRNLEQGQLIQNYLGHGGPKGWAQERVLQINDLNSLRNMDRLPLIITATCTFTGFDDPSLISAGEHAISNPNGGAVALMTTVRPVYASENKRLAEAAFDHMFMKENGENLRIGEILRLAKNSNHEDTTHINSRKFLLIGDPAMQLATPKNSVVLNKINNVELDAFQDTLEALERVVLEGQVNDQSGNLLSDFNGVLNLKVFDKPSEISTLGNDSDSPIIDFEVRKNILFRGNASVENGKFIIEFIIPKEINFENGFGKFSFYAHDNESVDAMGYYDQVVIGGSSESLVDDDPPIIELFMNDEQFVYGGITDDSPTLLVKLKDDNGINVTGNSIGHDLSFVLDDQEDQRTILNSFYVSSINDFRSGSARYDLKDLSPGLHKIRVKAWDISNNSSEATIEFNVLEKDNSDLFDVYNYPNPMVNNTFFSFEHDLDDFDLNISVLIYTIDGKLVKNIEKCIANAGYRISDLEWDGTDEGGNRLAQGIYLYTINLQAKQSELIRKSDFKRIVLY